MTSKNSPPALKKSGIPPIAFILPAGLLLFGLYRFWSHPNSDPNPNPQTTISDQASPLNQPVGAGAIQGRMSRGTRLLITAGATWEKEAGVKALAAGDGTQAIAQFQASLQKQHNDPETLIYLNNAKIGQGKALQIAVSVPIGSNLNVALEILRGVAQAQDEINRNGGINGMPLLVEIANDENSPDLVKPIASELVQDKQILAVIGHNASNASLAAAPIYQQGGLVMVSPTSSANNLSGFGGYIFRTMPTVPAMTNALAQYAIGTDHHSKIALCYDSQAPDNVSFKDAFIAAILSQGGKFIPTPCDFSAPTFNPAEVVNQAISDGADTLLLAPHIDRLEQAIQVARANKGRLALLGSSSLYTGKTLQTGQGDVNNLTVVVPWHPMIAGGNPFLDHATQLWGGAVSWRTALAYDATWAVITGLKQSQSREGLQQALRNPGFTAAGAGDKVQFLPTGDRQTTPTLVKVQPGGTFGYEFAPLRS